MNQLFAAFGIDWHLLIAQALNFGLVMLALWYFLYRPVLSVLEKRREMIAKGVTDAQEAKEKLAHADDEAAHRVSKADEEAEGILKSARAAATAEKTAIVSAAEARAAQVAKDAEARAVEEAMRTRRESEKEVARLAILAAEKVIGKHHEAR
jgi:F-type H+-transporting ATPase subunit b